MSKGVWKRTEYHKKLARQTAATIDLIARGIKISTSRLGKKYPKAAEAKLANKNPQWTGEFPSYTALHKWIVRNYGKASKCENLLCEGKSKSFDWALKKGKIYERHIECFWQLCRSCHIQYDRRKT